MLTVTALFTRNIGIPATGLALAEIDLSLYQRAKADGSVSDVWVAEHPTEEIGGGLYSKSYADDDSSLYQYFGQAVYTGAVVLDSNYSLYSGGNVLDTAEIIEAILEGGNELYSKIYTITVGGMPLAGVYCRLTTDREGLMNKSFGVSNGLGQVVFRHSLPVGTTVYIHAAPDGYNPLVDQETI